MITLETEMPVHVPAREGLLDRCFGPARHRKTCERLRRGRRPADGLAFSALEDGGLIGTVRLWNIDAGSAGSALLLGPLGVVPERRGEGIAVSLVNHAIEAAARLGHRAVLLVGDPDYYDRFGFDGRLAAGLALPGPVEKHRFLGLELADGFLRGAKGLVVPKGPLAEPVKRLAIAAAA